jgi:hypothetical protein
MPTDPLRRWVPEPAVDFQYPLELANVLKEIFDSRGFKITESNAQRLAALLGALFDLDGGKLVAAYLDVPPPQAEYRKAAERLLRILHVIDRLMIGSDLEPARCWREVSLALELPSSRSLGLTEKKIGCEFGRSKMAVSKSITRLLRLAELKPHALGYNGRQ